MTTDDLHAVDPAQDDTVPNQMPPIAADDAAIVNEQAATPQDGQTTPRLEGTADSAQNVDSTIATVTSPSAAAPDEAVSTPVTDAPADSTSAESGSDEAVATPSVPDEVTSTPNAGTAIVSTSTSDSDATDTAGPAAAADTSDSAPESDAAVEQASTSATGSVAPAAPESAMASSGPVSDVGARVRERLASQRDDQAVGSSDAGTPQERSHDSAPVEIPSDDQLDASLEAQISAAMTSDVSAPVETAPVAGGESNEGDTEPQHEELGPGSQLRGAVQQIHGDDVFIEAGVRGGIVVPLRQFPENKKPNLGDELTVIIDSVDTDGLYRARVPHARHKAGGNWDALAVGQVVDCMVTATNKGGLQVSVSSLRGFMPASQVDLGYVADLEAYVGQKLTAQITEVNKKKRNLVLSRRILLQAERASQQGDFWSSLEVGQDHEGTVKTIKDYGAFVNLGPMDGFLHIGEMAWSRINHPSEVLSEGQTVKIRILKLDPERQRISLGMKQLVQNPWLSAVERYAPERIVPGKVTRIADFGAFVELEPGIEGLVHISELAWRRVRSVGEVLSQGESRDFQVIEVDPKRKRISLSVKALEQQPDQPAREDHKPAPERKPNPDLRGGTSGQKGGSDLFGNPSDFT